METKPPIPILEEESITKTAKKKGRTFTPEQRAEQAKRSREMWAKRKAKHKQASGNVSLPIGAYVLAPDGYQPLISTALLHNKLPVYLAVEEA